MKALNKITILFLFLFLIQTQNIFSQDKSIVGTWQGTLNVQGTELRLVLNVDVNESDELTATLDSPDQGVSGLKVDEINFDGNNLSFKVNQVGGSYVSVYNKEIKQFEGTWKQGGLSFPLNLEKVETVEAPKGEYEEVNENNEFLIGNWQGKLKAGAFNLRVIFRFYEEDGKIKAFMDSPDQGSKDIPVTKVVVKDDSLFTGIKSAGAVYDASIDRDSLKLKGEWKQMGMIYDLILKKVDKIEEPKRPQEPKPPYPYNEEEVSFVNEKDTIKLAGTFTFPDEGEKFPAVVLISGSGPQNRNEELLGHKPFLVLADYLTRHGIAVLRYDDRGVADSDGNFSSATSQDFAEDVNAAVNYLFTRDEVDKNNIGLIGHSEGGLIAPIVANANDNVDFIVMMAGPGVPGKDILLLQTKLILEANGSDSSEVAQTLDESRKAFEIITTETDSIVITEKLEELYDETLNDLSEEDKNKPEYSREAFEQQSKQLLSPWFRYFLKYDPRPALRKLDIPVLSIIGEKDLQVPPFQNIPEIKKALEESESENFKVIELPGLNHLFQKAETGAPSEYGNIEETISPVALETITKWIKEVSE